MHRQTSQCTKYKERKKWGVCGVLRFLKTKARMEKHNPCDKSLFLWGTCQVLRRKRTGMCRADHTNQGDKTTHEGEGKEG